MKASSKLLMIFFIISAVDADLTAKSALRVMGGRDARPGEYPYVVALEKHLKAFDGVAFKLNILYFCTGAAISSTWTLTAAQCLLQFAPHIYLNNTDNMKVVVRYGDPHKSLSENNKFSTILKAVIPPASINTRKIKYEDIGLTQSEPMAINTFGKISSIDITSLYGYEVTLLGYGKMADSLTNIVDAPLYLNKSLQIIDKAVMFRCDGTSKIHPTSLFRYLHCAAYRCDQKQNIHYGDSGGPVVHASGIVGVNVAIIDKKLMRYHESFTRIVRDIAGITSVSENVDWINSHISS